MTAGELLAGELLAGDVFLYVDDSDGSFSAANLSRLDEAIANLDVLLATYNVTVTEVSDRGLANLVLNVGATSAVGGYADGVLGCFTNTGEITLIQGWDWYAGADPAAIGAGQFDFQTIVTHEIGHALGLGHSEDSTSVMYAMLSSGVAHRALTNADLNVADDGSGPSALCVVSSQHEEIGTVWHPAVSAVRIDRRHVSQLLAIDERKSLRDSTLVEPLRNPRISRLVTDTTILVEPVSAEVALHCTDAALASMYCEPLKKFRIDTARRTESRNVDLTPVISATP